jgi:hypothetical protein
MVKHKASIQNNLVRNGSNTLANSQVNFEIDNSILPIETDDLLKIQKIHPEIMPWLLNVAKLEQEH